MSKESNKLFNKVAKKRFQTEQDKKIFVSFMKKRFPDESSASYVVEWADRFNSGHPQAYMDSESTNAYHEVLKQDNDTIFRKHLKKR